MNKVLADNGYYQAGDHVQADACMRTRDQMDIVFHVMPGDLARVGEVTIQGDTGILPEQVRSSPS